ncbi:MAG: DUF2391 family protein [Candidatus Diapherotrites archaeon]|nr:DUF2391 family protein [Candidatus Diapherotrites archaeon]MDZ4256933.1 DUF2391 family protein [archaeon]
MPKGKSISDNRMLALRQEISEIRKGQRSILRVLHEKVARKLPDRFVRDDLAQQIVGAMILSAPLVVSVEVWTLSQTLDLLQMLAIVAATMAFNILLLYFTKFQVVEHEMILGIIPTRIFSLILVSYIVTAIMLFILGVITTQTSSILGAAKLIVMVGLFANIGAATADMLK